MKYCPKIYNNQASLLSVELASERVQSSDIVVAVGTAKGYCYLSLGSPIIDLRRAADEGHGVAMILNTEGLRGSLFRAYVTIIRAEYVADMCAETILAGSLVRSVIYLQEFQDVDVCSSPCSRP